MGKGSDRERQAVEILQRVGYATYRPATVRYGENDPFGLFDVLAFHPSMPPRFVQVKSNGARGIRDWTRHTHLWRAHGILTEFWVPHDREGWRIIQATDDGHTTVCDERGNSSCNMGEGVVGWLERDLDA